MDGNMIRVSAIASWNFPGSAASQPGASRPTRTGAKTTPSTERKPTSSTIIEAPKREPETMPSASIVVIAPEYGPPSTKADYWIPIRPTTDAAAGTITVDTKSRVLYLSLGDGKAMRYGVGVGRKGFEWSGSAQIGRKAEWPDWTPPPAMLKRRPDLPKHMAGGVNNPLMIQQLEQTGSIIPSCNCSIPGLISRHPGLANGGFSRISVRAQPNAEKKPKGDAGTCNRVHSVLH